MRSDGVFCMRPTAVQGRAELALQSREPRLLKLALCFLAASQPDLRQALWSTPDNAAPMWICHARLSRIQGTEERKIGAQNYQKRPLAQHSVLLHSTSPPLLLSSSLSYLSNLTKASR